MKNTKHKARLILADGKEFSGEVFGKKEGTNGEVVFSTAMVGYEQSLTDPSFRGQILVFTYPLIGNYGVPKETRDEYGLLKNFESDDIHVKAVIVSEQSRSFSHWRGSSSVDEWFQKKGITGLCGIDTRALTEYLREHGSQKGQIVLAGESVLPFAQIEDPNDRNLVAQVSVSELRVYTPEKSINKTVLLYDVGVKNNILRCFLKRGVTIIRLPWDYDIKSVSQKYDGVFFSNGPGDPKTIAPQTSTNIQFALEKEIPFWGICLGNQLLALALGGKTKKMKYGHRGVNQPCQDVVTRKCVITSQNHGYEVDAMALPEGWKVRWKNLNDDSVEGIFHEQKKAFSVQFHPEACPGPEDSEYLFDEFIGLL